MKSLKVRIVMLRGYHLYSSVLGSFYGEARGQLKAYRFLAMLLSLAFKMTSASVYMRSGMILGAFDNETVWEDVPIKEVIVC